MNIITIKKSLLLGAMLAFTGFSSMAAAITFVKDGVIYKTDAAQTKVTIQKATTAVPEGNGTPSVATLVDLEGNPVLDKSDKEQTVYSGDFVISKTVEYDGKSYTLATIGALFAKSMVTSIQVGDGVAVPRGAFASSAHLKTVVLPSDLEAISGNTFQNCASLETIVIPGTVASIADNAFMGCAGLKSITFEDGAELAVKKTMFPDLTTAPLQEIVLNRQIVSSEGAVNNKIFRANASLAKVTLGGSFTKIESGFFANCTSLAEVVINSTITEIADQAFYNTGLTSFTVPAGITAIQPQTFAKCPSLTKVVLPEGFTTVGTAAFQDSPVKDINLPETLTVIGNMAFSGSDFTGDVVLPDALTSLGEQAFANNANITGVTLGSQIASIGEAAFMGCTSIAKYTVSETNAVYKTAEAGALLTDAEGKTILAGAPAAALAAVSGDYTAVGSHALYLCKNVTSINLPKCAQWGDYAVAGTGISEIAISGTVGRYVASACQNLETITIDGDEVPFGVVADCPKVASVNLLKNVLVVKQEAFKNTPALKTIDLGNLVSILEADAFEGCGFEKLIVCASNPAGMAEGVLSEKNSAVQLLVPIDLVDTYKAATGFKELNVVGDANLAAGPADMGMPAGLYYAGKDGMLHAYYEDGNSDTYDVGGVPHTFQLVEFKNRIYGASAGKQFTYTGVAGTAGDGKLFYISKIGGKTFQAIVFDNTGSNAYKDPFGLYIYGNDLFVNDRNVAIRKVSADAIALPLDYPSWMENNWMGFYSSPWTYGCIKAGWAITKGTNFKGEEAPVYWLGMKHNGQGIFRFMDENVGTGAGTDQVGVKPEKGEFLTGLLPIITTFNIDEKNGHMYLYVETMSTGTEDQVKGGIYRINLADLEANPNPAKFAELNPVLIDGSPVAYEGSGTNEHIGIPQLSFDENGEYMYWCSIAPTAEAAAKREALTLADQNKGEYWWAETYDAANPLHKSGIKRIKLGEENPKVEMVLSGVEGYGVVPVKFAGSKKPDSGVNDVISATPAVAPVAIEGDLIIAREDANVKVYNMSGTCVAYATLAAGASLSTADLPAGAYIVAANGAAVKFVK